MSTQPTYSRGKPSITSCKTAFRPFIIQFSHVPYNQQNYLQRKSTPNLKKVHQKHQQNSQSKENRPILSVKENVLIESKSYNSKFTINSIEKLILGPVSQEECKKYVYSIYKGVIYSQLKLRQPSEDFVNSRSVFLSEPTGSTKKFLLLDLDQTLIYTEKSAQKSKTSYRFIYRPHLFPFLERMAQLFEVYVFTAAQKSYAEAVIQKLNRKKIIVQDFLHRQHCLETRKGHFLKDLRVVANRTLKDIIMLDNLVESFGLQLSNGVPILEFTGAKDDEELLKVIPLMEEVSEAEDVRSVLRERLRLEEVCGLERKEVQAYLSTTKSTK